MSSFPRPVGFSEVAGLDIAYCWIFKDTDLVDGLTRLKSYGFEGVELWPDMIERHGVNKWEEALTATGMKCFQLCPYFNFMGGEPTMIASRLMFEKFMTLARQLSCRRLRVFTGPPWGEGIVGGREATPQQWADAIAGLRMFCAGALPLGVELCLECHEGSLMEDGLLALKLIQAVEHPNLTVNLQLPLVNESWEQSLSLLATRTTHMHIHNWTQGFGQQEITYLQEGVFDWRPVLHRLVVEHKRRVCVSVEHGDHYGRHDPWETARRDGPYLQTLKQEINDRLTDEITTASQK